MCTIWLIRAQYSIRCCTRTCSEIKPVRKVSALREDKKSRSFFVFFFCLCVEGENLRNVIKVCDGSTKIVRISRMEYLHGVSWSRPTANHLSVRIPRLRMKNEAIMPNLIHRETFDFRDENSISYWENDDLFSHPSSANREYACIILRERSRSFLLYSKDWFNGWPKTYSISSPCITPIHSPHRFVLVLWNNNSILLIPSFNIWTRESINDQLRVDECFFSFVNLLGNAAGLRATSNLDILLNKALNNTYACGKLSEEILRPSSSWKIYTVSHISK